MAAQESFTLALRGIEKILSSIATTLPYQKVDFLYQTNLEFNQNTPSHSKSLSEINFRGGSMPIQSRHQSGFTLIELITVISLIAIAAVWAAPSMASLIRSNRASGEINQVGASIRYSKSEAIKRGLNVIICPSSDSASCSSSNNWGNGWIIYVDSNSNGSLDSGEPILKTEQKFQTNDQLLASGNASNLKFNRDGFAFDLPSSASLTLTLTTTPQDASAQRCLVIGLSGSFNILKQGASGCA